MKFVAVVIIIQARMGSSRLPGKIMKKLNGKPIIQHILEFLKFTKTADKIVIATTTLPEDDIIESFSKKFSIDCFRGDPNNVLKRYYDCAKKFNADLVVRLTADNPLIDPNLVDELVSMCRNNRCDYTSNCLHITYPYGYSTCEVLTFSILKYLCENKTDPQTIEHVTFFIRQNPHLFNVQEIKAPSKLSRPNWRLSVDTEEDFQLMEKIFSHLYRLNHIIKYETLVKFLDSNQDLLISKNN